MNWLKRIFERGTLYALLTVASICLYFVVVYYSIESGAWFTAVVFAAAGTYHLYQVAKEVRKGIRARRSAM